jgi:hypothetical protein
VALEAAVEWCGIIVGYPAMTTRWKTSLAFRDDVTFYWTGGRNVTWRLTHEPTGIVVEGSTDIPEARFTKKRLRIAEEKLKAHLLDELEQRVARHLNAEDKAG